MSRPLRIEYPGAWYHFMNRGRRFEKIFADDKDYEWSSHKGYLSIAKKWDWLHKTFVYSLLTENKKEWMMIILPKCLRQRNGLPY